MEKYREELGDTCGAKKSKEPLTKYEKLTKKDVK